MNMRKLDVLLTFICLIGGAIVGAIGLISIFGWCEIISHGWDVGAAICGFGLFAGAFAIIKEKTN